VTFRRMVWPLVVAVTLAGMVFVFFLPGRTLLQQRASLAAAETRVRVLSAENAKLATRVQQLHSSAEIEQLARERYNLVKPGEEAYAILPSPQLSSPSPPAKPAKRSHRGLFSRVRHDLAFWE
jgi:cell division protein FtsB